MLGATDELEAADESWLQSLVLITIEKMNMRGPLRLQQFPCACSGLGGSYRRVSTTMVLRIQKSNARELQPTYREITSGGMQNKVPLN